MTPIISDDPDAQVFNEHLKKRKIEDGHTSPYNTQMLFAEAYIYRRIKAIFENKTILKNYDYFKKIKEDAFEDATPIMRELAIHMEEGCECISDKDAIFDLIKIALWANKYDLALNKGVEHGTHLNFARKMEPNVACDNSEAIWEAFRSNHDNDTIAYVPDNAGYELFCDLALCDMLFTKGLTSHVTFHTKTIPSYVSDVTKNDIIWMIQTLKKHIDPHLRCLGQRWDEYMANQSWEIVEDPFWHYPLDYTQMQEYAPELYDKLASANLIIFKGDLAYRKLLGDINWDPDTPLDQGLRGFLPAKLCVLRTVKYGVVCGIASEVAEKCMKADTNWKESGNYGLIQYCDTIYVEPPQEEMIFPPDPGADGTEAPKAAADMGEIEDEAPVSEVEGAGDLGQVDESGGEARTGDDVAHIVASIVGHSSQEVDKEWDEQRIPETTEEELEESTDLERFGEYTVRSKYGDEAGRVIGGEEGEASRIGRDEDYAKTATDDADKDNAEDSFEKDEAEADTERSSDRDDTKATTHGEDEHNAEDSFEKDEAEADTERSSDRDDTKATTHGEDEQDEQLHEKGEDEADLMKSRRDEEDTYDTDGEDKGNDEYIYEKGEAKAEIGRSSEKDDTGVTTDDKDKYIDENVHERGEAENKTEKAYSDEERMATDTNKEDRTTPLTSKTTENADETAKPVFAYPEAKSPSEVSIEHSPDVEGDEVPE
ncbi:hypothetical protein HHI36_020286 [Cryptolaemus montrouzieri]|uniref:Damage-control phosphatase ARMT1 n=1 Tax=Cryptolaemus montrouzieri TaxID=559131 RepID=A0ABD2NA87_9CUCU